MKYQCVIFDCDGVLVDSEILYHLAGVQELTALDLPLTLEKSIELFTGASEQMWPKIIYDEYGRLVSSEALALIMEKVRIKLRRDLKGIFGMDQILNSLGELKVIKCIASNSKFRDIKNVLATTKLDRYFSDEIIFDISQVRFGKPAPDIFLHAAMKMGVEPAGCLVVEDSVVGIEAAKAAGMDTVGFLGGSHAQGKFYRDQIIAAQPLILADDSSALVEKILPLMK